MLAGRSLVLAAIALAAAPAAAEQVLVRSPGEYDAAIEAAQPGDTILLADGEWRDFDLVVRGDGTGHAPLTVAAQTPGGVVLTGQSSLRLGGSHLVVSGLVFRNGYSPRGDVIAFRVDSEKLAFDSRVTQTVIDGFSKPDRYESDYWVAIYGKRNRFDHNHLEGKTNKGVTLAVRLDSENSRENGHRIDHNYFGPRQSLGSNGGETLRIGTSHYSMFDSKTIVENNVFDRTDGEVEIISSKSGGNTFRGNLFLRSRGNLTLRHGDGNLVERNIFLGHGKDYTGGIRVINRDQTVRDNYMEGLRGTGFSSALAVMNGVPNSPVNRYVEVENAQITGNSILDSARIGFGVGADEERSAAPSKTVFARNLMSASGSDAFLSAASDVSGIAFDGNVVLSGTVDPALAKIARGAAELERAKNGLLYPRDPAIDAVGAPRDLAPIGLEEVGVDWYPKPKDASPFESSGRRVTIAPGVDALVAAVEVAQPGDVIELAPGRHVVERTIALDKAITIRGTGPDKPVILFSRPSLIELREGGDLQLVHLVIDGSLAPDSVGNSVIRTTIYPVQSNMQIEFERVEVRNLTVNKSFNVLTLGKSTFADRIAIRDSAFSDISGTVISVASETEDYGQYNVEYLDVADSSFENIGGPIADVYRGGRDESTFGPAVTLSNNTLRTVGRAATNGSGAALHLHGVQIARIEGNTVSQSAPLRIVHTVGTPATSVVDNSFDNTPAPVFEELIYQGAPRVEMSGNSLDGEPLQ